MWEKLRRPHQSLSVSVREWSVGGGHGGLGRVPVETAPEHEGIVSAGEQDDTMASKERFARIGQQGSG